MYLTSTHDLFCDAFFIHQGRLIFASLYGQNANVQSLLAQMNNNGGADLGTLGFREQESGMLYPPFTTARHFFNLYKHTTKINTQNYGVLVHAFVYCGEVVCYDIEAKTAWLLSDNLQDDMDYQVWLTVNTLTDVPLLESWRNVVLERLKEQNCMTSYSPGITAESALVGVRACRICIPEDFDRQVETWLRSGILPTT